MKSFIASCMAATAFAGKYEALYSHHMERMFAANPSNGTGSPIQIELDGEMVTKYIATVDWAPCSGSGTDFNCPSNGRGYIMNPSSYNVGNPDYFTVSMLGGYIEFDADLSQHECGCFNTFYTVGMPGYDGSGNLDGSDSFHYCDANAVGGNFCPEIDLMEANKFAFQSTPHKCDAPSNRHYGSCDTGGSFLSSVDHGWSFGPGGQYTIDTTQKIHVKVEVEENNKSATKYTVTVSQNGKSQQMVNTDSSYLGQLSDAFTKQVFVISNWFGDSSWLNKGTCSGSCWNKPSETISNIKIKSGISGGDVPPVKPGNWEFGDNCAAASNCTGGCALSHCKWSWPKGSSWDDPQAACRCDNQ